MELGPIEINKSNKLKNLKKRVLKLEDRLTADRTKESISELMGGEEYKIPEYPYPKRHIYELSKYSPPLNNIFQTIQTELFRNGWEFEKRCESYCSQCGKEYQEEKQPEGNRDVPICDNCGGKLIKPRQSEIKDIKKQLRNDVNYNNQSLTEVCQELEWDLEAMDKAFLHAVRIYEHNENGDIVNEEVDEIVRIHPVNMFIVENDEGIPAMDNKGKPINFCPEHRERKTDRDYCKECGRETLPAFYVKDMEGDRKEFFSDGEVKFVKKYHPTETYGWPPAITCWQKIHILLWMDNFILKWYNKERPPGLLVMNTKDQEGLRKSIEEANQKAKDDPHAFHPISVESPEGSGKFAEYVKFSDTLKEMNYNETRKELKKDIGSLFGVTPLFQNQMEDAGGLNAEGQQINVTNRAMQRGQEVFNDKIFPWLLKQLDIGKGWKLKLREVETMDVAQEEKINQMKIQNASQMNQMGFNVELDEENDEEFISFEYTGEAQQQQQGNQRGGQSTPFGDMGNQLEPQGSPIEMSADKKNFKENMKKAQEKEHEKIEKQENRNLLIKRNTLQENLDKLIDELWNKRYEGLDWDKSKKITQTIAEALRKNQARAETVSELTEKIGDELTENQAETIVRTEYQNARNKIREATYRSTEGEKDKYKWIGPTDHRTTDTCREIERKTEDGVTLDELKKIIKETAQEHGHEPREFTPHINCYSKDTEIMTEEGFKPIKEVKKGEKVLSLNPETKDLEYAEVTDTIEKEADKINKIKSKTYSIAVDKDHPHFVYHRYPRSKKEHKPMRKKTSELNASDKFYVSSEWKGEDKDKIEINGKKFNTDDFCKFMGYYLSEGSKGKSNKIKIAQNNDENRERMYQDMKNAGFETISKYNDYIYIRDKAVRKYVDKLGKSHEKHVPREIKELSKKHLRVFLDAYLLGDGSIRKGREWKGYQFGDSNVYFTSSKRMMSDLVEIIIKSGKSASIKYDNSEGKDVKFKNGEYSIKHPCYRIYELKSEYRKFDRAEVTEKDYDDYVYDVSLDRNHTLLIKHDEKVSWNSNCRHTFTRAY